MNYPQVYESPMCDDEICAEGDGCCDEKGCYLRRMENLSVIEVPRDPSEEMLAAMDAAAWANISPKTARAMWRAAVDIALKGRA